MSVILHPRIVAVGILYLDAEKTQRLTKLIEALEKRHPQRTESDEFLDAYIDLVTDFLVREVGLDELAAQYRRSPRALRDAQLFPERQ